MNCGVRQHVCVFLSADKTITATQRATETMKSSIGVRGRSIITTIHQPTMDVADRLPSVSDLSVSEDEIT